MKKTGAKVPAGKVPIIPSALMRPKTLYIRVDCQDGEFSNDSHDSHSHTHGNKCSCARSSISSMKTVNSSVCSPVQICNITIRMNALLCCVLFYEPISPLVNDSNWHQSEKLLSNKLQKLNPFGQKRTLFREFYLFWTLNFSEHCRKNWFSPFFNALCHGVMKTKKVVSVSIFCNPS